MKKLQLNHLKVKDLKNITVVLGITLCLLACNDSNNHKMKHNKQEIIDIEQQRVDALLQNDIVTLTKIMHTDAIHISSTGKRTTTTQWLVNRKNNKQPFVTFTLNNDQTIRFYKNIAIIDGSYTNSKQIDSIASPLKHACYTRIYKKTKDKG